MRKKKNIVLENLLVEDYAAEGKSLARKDGKVIFIEGAVPGDVVNLRLGKSKKDWAEGYPLQFLSYSKERVTPFCQHFGICGGCQWQMLPYDKQLQYKHKQVYDNLTRIGKIALPEFYPIAGAAETQYYRNKLEYTFSTKEFTEEKPALSISTNREEELNTFQRQENDFFEEADPILYPLLKEFVSIHRKKPTVAEEFLWQQLRGKQLENYKFRRQHIIGSFIADFVCLSKKLIIEVDGLIHQLPENKISDAERTAWLNKKGYEVLRFTNEEILFSTEDSLNKIKAKLDELPFAEKKLYSNEASLRKALSADPSPVGGGQEGAGSVGFHARRFFDKVVAIEKCWLQAEPTNDLRNAIRDFARENNLSFYNIREHHGLLRTMQVRLCTTGEIMVNIVFGEEKEKKIKQVLQFIEKEFPQITTLLYTINLKWNDSLHDLEPVVYKGKGYVIEKLEDFQFKIGPKSFFQTNTKQGEKLYQITREFAELDGSQTLYDLYCGTGSIGIFCSRNAKKIIGVEVIDAAVQDARENAALNGIDQAAFFTGDVIDVCNDEFFAQHGRPDVIITDPPRAGMHEKLVKKILDMEAPTVVYVSCNPATQARDLALLDEKYEVTKVQPVDMFPHTHHIENVAQLKLREKN